MCSIVVSKNFHKTLFDVIQFVQLDYLFSDPIKFDRHKDNHDNYNKDFVFILDIERVEQSLLAYDRDIVYE